MRIALQALRLVLPVQIDVFGQEVHVHGVATGGRLVGAEVQNMDVVDRVQRDDVIQMAVVVATFAYNTAMRDERLPRKPLPRVEP